MGKGPVHLVFGVAVNKRYRTVFGMEKIDQGRHEGALTTTTFSPHRHDNSFLIIGFVTHFLVLFACPLKFLRLKALTPCRVLGLGVRLSRAFGPFPDSLEDAARVFPGIVSRFCLGGRRRLSQWLGSEWIGTTLDPTHETAYRARSHLVSEVFCVSKVIRDLLPGFTGPSPGFNLVGKRDQLALEWFPWHLRTYFYLLSL
jgi:hypothetical protein